MKRKWVLGTAALLLIGGISTACSSKDEDGSEIGTLTTTTLVQTGKEGPGVAKAGAKPRLDAQFVQAGRSVTINYKVENLKISSEHVGHDPVQGEGHLHIYVDGKQKAVLNTEAPVKLENLTPGKHTIKLDLQNNNHTPLQVEKVFEIEVK